MARKGWLPTLSVCLLIALKYYDGAGIDSVTRISHVKAHLSFCSVVQSGKGSVDGEEPASTFSIGDGRKFKLQRLPICVDGNVTKAGAGEVMH